MLQPASFSRTPDTSSLSICADFSRFVSTSSSKSVASGKSARTSWSREASEVLFGSPSKSPMAFTAFNSSSASGATSCKSAAIPTSTSTSLGAKCSSSRAGYVTNALPLASGGCGGCGSLLAPAAVSAFSVSAQREFSVRSHVRAKGIPDSSSLRCGGTLEASSASTRRLCDCCWRRTTCTELEGDFGERSKCCSARMAQSNQRKKEDMTTPSMRAATEAMKTTPRTSVS
mmetsp:Transcript_28264/g.65377  ORF Transcript_28264/g.65377 Transcript_28264/m.65377 type:complete len:230 (-) Transcript_28264:2228-2917(-)